jgi:branched-chain amino acid transport system permease protein
VRRLVWTAAVLGALALLNPLLPRLLNPYTLQIAMLCGINVILAVSLNLINGFTGQFSIGHAGFMAVGAYTSAMVSIHVTSRWVALLGHWGAPLGVAQGVALLASLLAGGLAAAVAGYLVG